MYTIKDDDECAISDGHPDLRQAKSPNLSLERSVEQAVKQTTPAQNVREENVDSQYMISHS